MPDAETRLRELLDAGHLDLPRPGLGQTRHRFDGLQQLAVTEDLSVARLAEAHCDAAAILDEGGQVLPPGQLAGVWASRYGGGTVTATPRHDGRWHIAGRLSFCSGAPLLDVALVDARLPDGREQLFLIPLRRGGITVDITGWHTTALAATATGAVVVDLAVDTDAMIGEPGFYLARPGFWHGAIGVAACWAGGGRAVHDATLTHVRADQIHAVTNVGRSAAACWAMSAVLHDAADRIDTAPDEVGPAEALTVRLLVATACDDILAASRRATGPGPVIFDSAHGQRIADLRLYIEQQHYEADLAAIGTGALDRAER